MLNVQVYDFFNYGNYYSYTFSLSAVKKPYAELVAAFLISTEHKQKEN